VTPAGDKQESNGVSLGKWLAGLASAVIAGVAIWWFTSAGGPLDPAKPEVHVSALSVYPRAAVGAAPSATVTVENSGDGTADSCRILWSAFTATPSDAPFPASTDFSLGAGEERDQRLATSATYPESGEYEMAVQLTCENDESQVMTRTVAVG
jgi:hypothetical protein